MSLAYMKDTYTYMEMSPLGTPSIRIALNTIYNLTTPRFSVQPRPLPWIQACWLDCVFGLPTWWMPNRNLRCSMPQRSSPQPTSQTCSSKSTFQWLSTLVFQLFNPKILESRLTSLTCHISHLIQEQIQLAEPSGSHRTWPQPPTRSMPPSHSTPKWNSCFLPALLPNVLAERFY